jgi:hypothetical protein
MARATAARVSVDQVAHESGVRLTNAVAATASVCGFYCIPSKSRASRECISTNLPIKRYRSTPQQSSKMIALL